MQEKILIGYHPGKKETVAAHVGAGALKRETPSEYLLTPEWETGRRVWIHTKEPGNGTTEASIGITITTEGLSIDVWDTNDSSNGPILEPYLEWTDITYNEEE
tara:strand:- start:187 stop:495 length:309 start_codon:yes stop_codon:yes gene_type:complete